MNDTLEINLSRNQIEYIKNATHRWNLSVGAVRSGKSHAAIQYIIPNGIMSGVGKKGLNFIIGVTKESIERNVLAPMREIWGETLVQTIGSRNIAKIFGQNVYCLGAENAGQVGKIRGSEAKFVYCDEVCDINEEVFELLKSRLSLEYSQFHGAANPQSPTHWLKKFIDEAQEKEIDLYVQQSTIYDNPFLPTSYVKALENEYKGTVYYDRYILGLWKKAEGLIWGMYDQALESRYEGEWLDYRLSIDYGTLNDLVALKCVRDETGVWHIIDEYRYSGRKQGIQKTDDEYVQDLLMFVSDYDKEVVTYVDPSAASFIAALRKNGNNKFRVRHADNDVENGLRETAICLQGTQGLVKINEKLKDLIDELAGYVWDEKVQGKEQPKKENDHGCDALRYFVKTAKLYRTGKQQEYTSILG